MKRDRKYTNNETPRTKLEKKFDTLGNGEKNKLADIIGVYYNEKIKHAHLSLDKYKDNKQITNLTEKYLTEYEEWMDRLYDRTNVDKYNE